MCFFCFFVSYCVIVKCLRYVFQIPYHSRRFLLEYPYLRTHPEREAVSRVCQRFRADNRAYRPLRGGQQSLLTASGEQRGPPSVPNGRWSQPTPDGGQQNLPPPSGGLHGLPTPKSESAFYTTGFCGLTCEEIDEMLEVLQQQLPPQQQSVDSILDADLQQVLGMDVKDFLL